MSVAFIVPNCNCSEYTKTSWVADARYPRESDLKYGQLMDNWESLSLEFTSTKFSD